MSGINAWRLSLLLILGGYEHNLIFIHLALGSCQLVASLRLTCGHKNPHYIWWWLNILSRGLLVQDCALVVNVNLLLLRSFPIHRRKPLHHTLTAHSDTLRCCYTDILYVSAALLQVRRVAVSGLKLLHCGVHARNGYHRHLTAHPGALGGHGQYVLHVGWQPTRYICTPHSTANDIQRPLRLLDATVG